MMEVDAYFPLDTFQDVELIEILLQQDIDLGVGREAYDLNFRREKEKKELEAQQNHEKHLNDLAQQELQEQGQSQQPNPNMRYIVDDDTGETVAVPMESNETVALPEGYVAPESAAPTTNGYSGNVNLVPSQITSSVNSSVAMQHVNITRELTSQIQNLQNDIDNMTETAQNISLLADQPSTSGGILQHQNSIDARWEDVVSFINDENTTDVAATTGNMTFSGDVAATPGNMTFSGDVAATPGNMTFSGDLAALPNNSIDDLLLTANDSSASPLLQNATLGLPNITPTFELDAPNFPSTSDQNITNAGQLFQSTSSNQSFFDMDNGSYLNMLGNSQPMNITGINTTGNFLENLLNDNIGDVDMMEFSSGAPQTSPLLDDASSDSAVSSMSAASQLQDFNDTNTNRSTSPTNSLQSAAAGSESSYGSSLQNGTFDGLEGATAGEEYSKSTGSTYIKQERTYSSGYESPDYGFRGDDYNLNYSSTSNDSDYHYHPASMRHVNHNHTYPLQPGQEPRETQIKKNSPRDKIPRSRDDKKAKAHKLPFSTDEIINSPVERFSEMLTKHPFTETQLQLLKDIRRRGKNKLAAQNCRKRKIDAVDDISGNVTSLRAERNRLMKEKGQIDKQKREMEAKMSHLYREVFTS